MSMMRPAFLIVFAGLGLLQAPVLLAAQRPAEMAPPYGEMDRFLSPTELQLAELQRERQDLLQSREEEKNVRLLKNKITILNNKIAYLQRQIRLTKPYVVKTRLVPIRVKGAAAEAEPSPAEPAAISLAAKPLSLSDRRLEAQTAVVPHRLEPIDSMETAAREIASEQTLPLKIASKPLEAAALRDNPAEQILPVKMISKPSGAAALRDIPAEQTLPLKMVSKPFETSALRDTPATQSLPVKIASIAGKPFAPVSARLAAHEQAVAVKPGSAKTGAEWKEMMLADKEIYMLSVMGNLSRRDVYLMRPYGFYIQAIDQAIEKDPLLEQEFIHRILMATAYDSEPDTRKDLEKIWQ